MMLAMVMRMDSPKVICRMPRSRTRGEVRPKDWPKFSQESQETPWVMVPIKPPRTMPDKTSSRSTQKFLLVAVRFIYLPYPLF